MDSKILKIAEILSNNCLEILVELSKCIENTEQYYKENRTKYQIFKNIGGIITGEDYNCIQWIVLVESLVKQTIAAAFDWKCEFEDFSYFIKKVSDKKKQKFPFCKAWFQEDDSIEEWCVLLNGKWKSKGLCLAQLEMESDTYTILLLLLDDYKQVKKLACDIGQNIYLAGTQKDENAPHNLNDFFQRHPLEIQNTYQQEQTDFCVQCSLHTKKDNIISSCIINKNNCFKIIIKSQKLSAKQMISVSKYFRLNAMLIKKRLSEGKEVFVKSFLYDTMITKKQLEDNQIAYEILPDVPKYSRFYECPQCLLGPNAVIKDYNDYKYFKFDEEREKEWEI